MANVVNVDVGRTVTVNVDLNGDYTGDTFASQIRAERGVTSTLIATWTVTETDYSLGTFTLTLDDSVTSAITATFGYMDIERTTGGEPVSVLDAPLYVSFRQVVTT